MPPLKRGDSRVTLCDDDAMSIQESARLRTLLEMGIAISSDRSLDRVLRRIVEAASLS